MNHELLSHRLRSETREAHTAAERSGIMRALLRGTISVPAYVGLLENLAALYDALETELNRNISHAALSGVDWNVVRRLPALESDIKHLRMKFGVAADAPLAPSTQFYVDHLRKLGAEQPEFLFPHAYLRYLGDMYGGQIIKRIVLEKVIDGDEAAVSFHKFDHIGNLHEYIVSFRETLDAIPLSAEAADAMVAEAQLGYELHASIFEELGQQYATSDS